MVAFRLEPEQSGAGGSASSGLLEHPQEQQQQPWPQYSSVSSVCLRGRRDGFQQEVGASGRALRTDEDNVESTTSSGSGSDMESGSREPLRDSKTATSAMKRIRVKQIRVSKSHRSSIDSGSTPGHGPSRPLEDHAPVPGAHPVL
ncbi:hypothetical protein BGZ75_005056, partial [Mortierella antarctica]